MVNKFNNYNRLSSVGYNIRKSTKEEHQIFMQAMRDNFDKQDDAKVGIFWYDEVKDELFGVSKVNADELNFNYNGIKTLSVLHRKWWEKEKYKLQSRGQDLGIFEKDYTMIHRGRVFQLRDGTFQLKCGSWITDHITSLVIDEFDLHNVILEISVDEHWELGQGWSE